MTPGEPLVIGIDAGNSESTMIAPRGRVRTIPSFIGSGSLVELERIRKGAGNTKLEDDEFILEYEGRSYFVGRLALEQSTDATSARGDITRYWAGHTLKLLLVLAGALSRQAHVSINVVTGLPVQVWSKETVKKVRQSLVGTHTYRLNGQERQLTINGVMVLMEGAGALAVAGLPGDAPQAVIDVGGRTTDLFWAEGQKPVLPRCTGIGIGVEKVGDLLRKHVAERYDRELLPNEVRDIMRAYAEGRDHRPVYANGQPLIINGELVAGIRSVAEEIGSFIAQTWRSGERGNVATEAAQVLLIGGGAYYFRPAFQQLIRHLKVPGQPESQNAKGYLAVGLQVPSEQWMRLT
jgi:hypothetical protein